MRRTRKLRTGENQTYKETRDHFYRFYVQAVLNKPLPYPVHFNLELLFDRITWGIRKEVERSLDNEEVNWKAN